MSNDLLKNKYLKYKNKYIQLKQFGGTKHADEYTVCEIENKLLKKPSSVLIYTLQFPESMAKNIEVDCYTDGTSIIKSVSDLAQRFDNLCIVKTDESYEIYKRHSTGFYASNPHYYDNLTSATYTHIFENQQREKGQEILMNVKSKLDSDFNGKLLLIRNGSRGYAATILDSISNVFEHVILNKTKTITPETHYLYLDNVTREHDPEYMKLFLSTRSADLRGPGASTLGYFNYYKKLGISEPNIKIVFNTDNQVDKERAFASLNSNSHVIFIGHCCVSGNVTSDQSKINIQGYSITNPDLTAEETVRLITFIPTATIPTSNKSALINFNICNGYTAFIVGELLDKLNKVRVKPIIISKTEVVTRLGGMDTPLIEENIFNHTCGTPTMISFWNEKLGYVSVNANIFNISKETIFKNE